MAASVLPRGLILDLVTPLNPDGDLDERGLGRLLKRAIPHVQGILLAGPCGGEGEKLDHSAREKLLQKASLIVRARVPLLVWVTQSSPQATIETVNLLDKKLKKSRYHGEVFWVDTPLYCQSNRGLLRHYRELTVKMDRGWVLHNDPGLIKPFGHPFKRENIRTNILKELCTIEGIGGLIFSGSLDRAQNYQKAVRSASAFRIYDGEEARFLSHPSLSGIVSPGANLIPRAWQKITCSSLNLDSGNEEYPDRLQQIWETGAQIAELMRLYVKNPTPIIKTALFRKGILESPFSYRGDADPQSKRKMVNWLDAHPDFFD